MKELYDLFEHTPIEWVKDSQIEPVILEERHVRVRLPAKKHFNHVNTIYAGSIFMLAEITSGALFFSTYGMDKYAPVVQKVEISYSKPATGDIFAENSISEEEAQRLIASVNERGKGPLRLEMPILNVEGEECAYAVIDFYCIPVNKE